MKMTCYYIGTRPNQEGVRYNGDWEIWVQKLDLVTIRLIGKSFTIWKGALNDVICPEGPHLYKKDNYYYLMIAEVGTGPNNAVTVARSRQVFGPYENNPNNPILTHRHLGKDYPVNCVGHADLVDDTKGNWYIVMFASRRSEGHVGLRRETFFAKVVWEDGWPVVNPGIGKLEDIVQLPFECELPQARTVQSLLPFNDDKYDVVMLRNPKEKFYSNIDGAVRLEFLPETLKGHESPAYLGLRQLEYNYEAVLRIIIEELSEEETGFVILQSNDYHMLFRVTKYTGQEKGDLALQVVKCIKREEHLLAEIPLNTKDLQKNEDQKRLLIELRVSGYGQKADFAYLSDGAFIPVALNVDIHEMSTEVAGGFVGNTLGVYATSGGKLTNNYVDIV